MACWSAANREKTYFIDIPWPKLTSQGTGRWRVGLGSEKRTHAPWWVSLLSTLSELWEWLCSPQGCLYTLVHIHAQDRFTLLALMGRICHFSKWQIPPFKTSSRIRFLPFLDHLVVHGRVQYNYYKRLANGNLHKDCKGYIYISSHKWDIKSQYDRN